MSDNSSRPRKRYQFEISLQPPPPLDIRLFATANIDLTEVAEAVGLYFELEWASRKSICATFSTHTRNGHWPLTVYRNLCPYCETSLKEVIRKGPEVELHVHETGPPSEERKAELIQELKNKPAKSVGYRYQSVFQPRVVDDGNQETRLGAQVYQPGAAVSDLSGGESTANWNAEAAPYAVSREGRSIANVPAALMEQAAASCPALARALWGDIA